MYWYLSWALSRKKMFTRRVWTSQHDCNRATVWIWMAGRLIFWARKSHALHDVRTIKGPAYKNDQVGGEIVSSDEEDDDEDEDILSTVRRRLGRFKKKKRPWTKVDGEKLVLLYGRWRGLPEATRAELIVTDQRSTFSFSAADSSSCRKRGCRIEP